MGHSLETIVPDVQGGLPAPFTLEQFRESIVDAYAYLLRSTAAVAGADAAMAILGEGVAPQILYEAGSAEGFGLTYAQVRDALFVRCMENLYQFAYTGRLDLTQPNLGDDSENSWIAAFLHDSLRGEFLQRWEDLGLFGHRESLERCMHVADLANARAVLSFGEGFFQSASKDEADWPEGLTMRQLALLAGMEEMSVRAAANPKRANPLPIVKGFHGKTLIALDVAREWLRVRGRYIEVVTHWAEGKIDLTRSFRSAEDLQNALTARFESLGAEKKAKATSKLAGAGVIRDGELVMCVLDFQNEPLMTAIAEALELSTRLLVLRSREVWIHEQLRSLERELEVAVRETAGKSEET